MKFLVALVATFLVAQCLAHPHRFEIHNDVSGKDLHEFLELVKDNIHEVVSNGFAHLKQTEGRVLREVHAELENSVTALEAEANDGLNNLRLLKIANIEQCIQEAMPKIEALIEKSREESSKCVADVINTFVRMYQEVLTIANEANERIFELVGQLEQCEDTACRLQVSKQLVEEMFDLNTKVRETVAVAVDQMQQALPAAVQCLAAVAQENRNEILEIIDEIRKCALTSKSVVRNYDTRGIVEDIQKLIEEIRQRIQEIVNKGLQNIKDLVQALENLAKEQLGKALEILEKAVNEAKNFIENIKKEAQELGIDIQECIEVVEPRIEEINKKAREDLQNCVDQTLNRVQALVEDVQGAVENIENEFQGWIERFENCETVTCYVQTVWGLRDVLQKILGETTETINNAITTIQNATPELIQCTSTTATTAGTAMRQAAEDFKTCFDDKREEQFLFKKTNF